MYSSLNVKELIFVKFNPAPSAKMPLPPKVQGPELLL
jgi:hypothetical protein